MASRLDRAWWRGRRALRRWLGLGRPVPVAVPVGRPATADDLPHCFRLFLRREPSDADLATWAHELAQEPMSLDELVRAFRDSPECRRADAIRVALAEFVIHVLPSDVTTSADILTAGEYEPHVIRELAPLLRPGTVFVDVGANLGYQTLLAAARVGPTGRVHAFEPNPNNVALLRASLKANRFTNATVYPVAVSDRERAVWYRPDGANSTGTVAEVSPGQPTAFRAVALDDVLADLDRVDIVKLDIDGGEPRALRGMDGLLRRHRPVLFVEFCPECIRLVSDEPPDGMLEFLNERGYDLFDLDRVKGKSKRPLTKGEVLTAYEKCGITHLDLVAYPRRG